MFRTTKTGMEVGSLTIAVNIGRKEDNAVLWQDVTVFGKQNAFIQDIRKGDLVFASGRVTIEKWQDKTTGENREKQGLIANDIYSMAPRERIQQQPANHRDNDGVQEDDFAF